MKPVSGCMSLEEQNLARYPVTLGPNGIALLVASYLLLFVTERVDFMGSTNHRKGPKRAEKDRKGPKRAKKNRK